MKKITREKIEELRSIKTKQIIEELKFLGFNLKQVDLILKTISLPIIIMEIKNVVNNYECNKD